MKLKNITENDMRLRHMDFPAGKAVEVDDADLAAKCLAMPEFVQVKPGRKAKKNDKDTA